MSFRLVLKSVTLNDIERRNGVILRCFSEFGYLPGALRKSSRSLSHLLMSSCLLCVGADRQTDIHAHRNTSHFYRGRSSYYYVRCPSIYMISI